MLKEVPVLLWVALVFLGRDGDPEIILDMCCAILIASFRFHPIANIVPVNIEEVILRSIHILLQEVNNSLESTFMPSFIWLRTFRAAIINFPDTFARQIIGSSMSRIIYPKNSRDIRRIFRVLTFLPLEHCESVTPSSA